MKFNDVVSPMDTMLRAARDTVRFHMPGHKGLLDPFDMTEIARTDDLYAPCAGIREAERLAAISCGAANSIALTSGGTAGIQTMILAIVSPGDTLILPRNAHHAALSACVLGDVNTVFADDLISAIQENPTARAVFVTRPDYYGCCADLAEIVSLAHARGMLVLVDEAHGAHFPWWDSPQSAGRLGADAFVQSAHKTLPALTGAAWLHLGKALDSDRARRLLRMVQTSSPPFPILRSLDMARAYMDEHGRGALTSLCGMLGLARQKIDSIEGLANVQSDDPTRMVIETRCRGLSGLEAQATLADRRVDIEMADETRIVCICTVADTQRNFDRLILALKDLPQKPPLPPVRDALPSPGMRVLPLRAAALSPQEAVPLEKAEGRVASVSAGMYPPGVPLVLPGETITGECVARLQQLTADRRFGVENGRLICVK